MHLVTTTMADGRPATRSTTEQRKLQATQITGVAGMVKPRSAVGASAAVVGTRKSQKSLPLVSLKELIKN